MRERTIQAELDFDTKGERFNSIQVESVFDESDPVEDLEPIDLVGVNMVDLGDGWRVQK